MLGFLSMSLWGWLQEFDTEGGGGVTPGGSTPTYYIYGF